MKKYLLIIGLFLFSCNNTINNTSTKKIKKKLPEVNRFHKITGLYFDENNQNIMLSIWQYGPLDTLSDIGKEVTNYYAKKSDLIFKIQQPNLLNTFILQNIELDICSKSLRKDTIRTLSHKYFYEIIDLRWSENKDNPDNKGKSAERPKIFGKLYLFDNYCGCCFDGGGLFMSDTTEKYGWFVIKNSGLIKGSTHINLDTKIFSMDKKAKSICGKYEKISEYAYRTLSDEEVEKW